MSTTEAPKTCAHGSFICPACHDREEIRNRIRPLNADRNIRSYFMSVDYLETLVGILGSQPRVDAYTQEGRF